MLSIHEHPTLEEASEHLLNFVLTPANWLAVGAGEQPRLRAGQDPAYQRRVGPLRICASVDVTPEMEVFLRVAFRAPGLTPPRAADHLEVFLQPRLPLTPNSEWQVEVDEQRWIHFTRKYAADGLEA